MNSLIPKIPPHRLEHQLIDKKPLLSDAEAYAEAERCLYCSDAPCIKACPTEIDIPTFIKKIATENIRGSARTILTQNVLGYSCSRVCPVEVLCEGSCVYKGWNEKPIAIGRLQRFAMESVIHEHATAMFVPKPSTGKKVALIGAGPASLACAAYLRLEGHLTTVFEKRNLVGGLNTTGVAPYKLHAEDSLLEVEWICSLGVDVRTGVEIGKDISGKQLLKEYDAVFLGAGLGTDNTLGIEGEQGPGVYGAVHWIETMKLNTATSTQLGRVVVVGGGNTAIDVARECIQLGAIEVTMVYRRDAASMSGYKHELDQARKEGVRLLLQQQPKAILRDTQQQIKAIQLQHSDEKNQTAEIPCDLVIVAIGQSKLKELVAQFENVKLDARGCVLVDQATGVTGNSKVFSGGDCVSGGQEVVNAVAEGRNAAKAIHSYVSKK